MLPLLIAAAGLNLAGGAIAAQGAREEAKADATSHRYNAAIEFRNAAIAREQAARDAETVRRTWSQRQGYVHAAYGASGVTLDGSALDVLEQNATMAELDRLNTIYGGEIQAQGYEDQAKLELYAGDVAIQQGRYRSAAAVLSGLSSAGQSLGIGLNRTG